MVELGGEPSPSGAEQDLYPNDGEGDVHLHRRRQKVEEHEEVRVRLGLPVLGHEEGHQEKAQKVAQDVKAAHLNGEDREPHEKSSKVDRQADDGGPAHRLKRRLGPADVPTRIAHELLGDPVGVVDHREDRDQVKDLEQEAQGKKGREGVRQRHRRGYRPNAGDLRALLCLSLSLCLPARLASTPLLGVPAKFFEQRQASQPRRKKVKIIEIIESEGEMRPAIRFALW